MIKKSLAILSISAAFYAQAQDASVLKNSVDVYSNTGLNGSSKYNAMAGAMGALGADASVLNSNPAGIGVAIASDLSGTLSINNSKITTGLFGNAVENTANKADVGQVGGIVVFETRSTSPWKFVNLGVNFSTKSLDEYAETAGNSNVAFTLDDGDRISLNAHAYDRMGDLTKMSLGLGGNYNNRFYVGAGLNLHGSNFQQYDYASMKFASDGASETFFKQYTPYLEDATGFSATVGVIGKVNNQFRLGAAVETPTWWNIDRTYTFYGYDSADDGEYSESVRFASPMKATLSAAFVPSKNLALNVDYSLGITKPKFGKMGSAAQTEMDNFLDANYKNVSEVKVGAEYRIQQFRLRGGYGLTTGPYSDMIATASINNLGQVDTNSSYGNLYSGKKEVFGLGLGYDFKTFYVDAAYNNIWTNYHMPFLQGFSTAGTEYYSKSAFFANEAAVVSETKNSQNNVTLTLGWKF
ncbi:OmpP1/FadL family transporter [Chryseobacterium taklimakanense]|uniref:Hemin receptor n=1 Tax=Chryseobacterium taklimakanense TaxID=536441 RepID=A0A3G8WI97_9FLAO|nr:hemin receptor [Chryseobacterium taklimakanense]AZI19998.1 hemin receptor [Chryseobacterium taklimakanense]